MNGRDPRVRKGTRRLGRRIAVAALWIVLAPSLVLAQDAPAPVAVPLDGAAAPVAAAPGPAHGFIGTTYRVRWTGEATDQDLWQVAAIDIGRAADHPWRFHVLGRWIADLDGGRRGIGFNPYDELADVREHSIAAYLYAAYVEGGPIPGLALLRAGRQTLDDWPVPLTLDGVRLESQAWGPAGLTGVIAAGAPVRQFDANYGRALGAAMVRSEPWPWLRARLGWLHVDGVDPYDGDRNDLWSADVRLRAERWGWVEARHVRIEGHPRDVDVRATALWPEWGTQLRAAYTRLLTSRTSDDALGLDDFALARFPLHAYQQIQAALQQPLGRWVTMEAGVESRRVIHAHEIGPFNREFDRFHVSGSVRDWPADGWSADADWSLWDSAGRHFWTVSGALEYRPSRRVRGRVGSDYALYSFDTTSGAERERLRTWFAEARYTIVEGVEWRVRYSWERDAADTYHRVEVRITWRF